MLKLAIILNILFIATLIYTFTPYQEVDKNLKPYLDNVINKIEYKCGSRYIHPVRFKLGFEEMNHYNVGYCIPSRYNMTIRVDPKWWEFSNEAEKQSLMAHEVFHCFMGANHSPDIKHFMHDMMPRPTTFEELNKQIDEYLAESCK